MSQYNWEWWFLITIFLMVFGLFIFLVAKTDFEESLGVIVTLISMVSLIPCLYYGLKND